MKKIYIVPAQQCVSLGLDWNVAGAGLDFGSTGDGAPGDAMVRGERDFEPIEETTSDEFHSPKTVWQTGW